MPNENSATPMTPQSKATPKPQTEFETSFKEWQFLIPRQNGWSPTVDVRKFFRLGWDLMNKNHTETRQQIIKKLASEEGLAMVKLLTNELVDRSSQEHKVHIFQDMVLPFFRTISYPDVLSSLILENSLDTIYNFLYGPNGGRALGLFGSSISALIAMTGESLAEDEDMASIAVTATLAVFGKTVELNQNAQIIPEFTSILAELSTSIPEQFLRTGSRNITRLRQRLGLGSAIPFAEGRSSKPDRSRPVFEIDQDLPGSLSELGPRHDNDHADISEISILPTTEEIQSSRSEYLPPSDPSRQHLPGLAGLLDRQFRLLREDTVGQLRDAVQSEHKRLSAPSNEKKSDQKHSNGARCIIYHNTQLVRLEFDRRKGIQIVIEFDQPLAVAKYGITEREEWWKGSKRLQTDAFVCLVSAGGHAIFFSISDPSPTPPPQKDVEQDHEGAHLLKDWRKRVNEQPSLFKLADRASVMLSFVDRSTQDITWITNHLGKAQKAHQSLIEFPGVLLPSFRPTLQALQAMSRTLDLPFSQFIAPNVEDPVEVNIAFPAYSLRPGFSFDLETLVNGEPLRLTPGQPFDYITLRENSTLDTAQQVSTIFALQRSLALIQGPPGTGKSFTGVAIIKALLKNREAAKLGPIVCVCYTNHALDQLLEHLIDDGVERLIRVGSRSKSERLQELTLQNVTKGVRPTKVEGHDKYLLYQKLESIVDTIDKSVAAFKDPSHWSNVKDYLEQYHYTHYRQLFGRGFDDQGFQEVRGKKFNILNSWLRGAPKQLRTNRPPLELLTANLLELSSLERSALQKYWVQESIVQHNRRLLHALDLYYDIQDSIKVCHQEIDIRCLAQAQVIGVTTSGLARNLDVLRRVQAKVVVIEEAGEVLEAHTLTALLPSVEHAILIGDHEQLRPQVNNYEFQHDSPRGAQFSLDISLFERLVHPRSEYPQSERPNLPYSSLEVQRRMHPSIAELVRATLYPKLQDHPSVTSYPEVEGMRKRLFWLDHNEKEDSTSSNLTHSFSKTNAWEVEMVAALVSHLVRQGVYKNEDIAVLTPYLGQLQKLKQRLRSSFAIVIGERDAEELEVKGLRDEIDQGTSVSKDNVRKTSLLSTLQISTVDNYQGRENNLIVISLVRCNDERKCGFLKTSNRINVLLSRARHGMYIIGNTQTARPVPMWDKVITILEANGNVGQKLALCCPRHRETPIEVTTPDDFSVFSPEGGCNLKCISRLSCGHACINKCHSEPLHSSVRCLERCQRSKKGCDHSCPKFCGDPCDSECQVQVSNINLPCGHITANLACHFAQAPATVLCSVLVDAIVPSCKHKVKIRCHSIPDIANYACTAICDAILSCGHNCKRSCKDCHTKGEDGQISEINHGVCIASCGRQYSTCSHACSAACHGRNPCDLCTRPCEVRCSHSRCSKKCHEPCVPCVEQCSWSCPHQGTCKMPCSVPCDMLPCSKRCTLVLSCGHQCPSVCGEICPNIRYCQQCAEEPTKAMMVDYIMGSTYAEVDLDESPCIVPFCGHLLALESMDGHMDMRKHYEFSNDPGNENLIIALKSNSVPFESSELKNCPMCRMPLRNINRYGRIVRRAWIDEATKKFIVWANSQFVPLASRMEQAEVHLSESAENHESLQSQRSKQEQLSAALKHLYLESIRLVGSPNEQINVIRKAVVGGGRYKEIFQLRNAIRRYRREVDEAEQPISRIHDLIEDARRHSKVTTEGVDVPSVLQVRHRLLATVLLLRCDYAILSDFFTHSIQKTSAETSLDARLDLAINRKECDTLVKDSHARQQPAQEVEGLLYWVRLAALERGHSATLSEAEMAHLIEHAHAQLRSARAICNNHPGQTRGMLEEVSGAEKMLRGLTFYAPVTNEEKAAVYAAMAQDFHGTGHWYYCVNGHPFTIGECGMPMETSRCPQCGATVGGTNHQAVDGVRQAEDMEELGRRRR